MQIKYQCPKCDSFLDVQLIQSDEVTLINSKGYIEFEDIECPNCDHVPYFTIDVEVS
ncbi:hypothetical protein [Dethiothermospora halolimnae]|uniref:hypothetical protein n=1 Tax=Dethiothermospora halolimnae TaxID=3114390 RepID=UPI003CCBB0F9